MGLHRRSVMRSRVATVGSLSPRRSARRPHLGLVSLVLASLVLTVGPLSTPPVAKASGLSLTFEASSNSHIVLGALASRTQQKPVTVSSSEPYTVTGTDSRTSSPYSYLTDVNYGSLAATRRESDERGLSGSWTFSSSSPSSYLGRSNPVFLRSSGNCVSGNSVNGIETFCAVFGPEIWTEPFDASAGQALSFDYAASAGDNYEVYAFLVKVEPSGGSFDYGGGKAENGTDPLTTHSLILHRRGKTTSWTTASGSVAETGKYRFRFVDGAFDQTGGYALGTDFYIDPASVRVGSGQTISFTAPGDQVGTGGTFTLSATSSAGIDVTFSSSTTNKCTVSGSTVTKVATGTCTITANAAEGTVDGVTFVAAQSVVQSFEIRAAATAPQNTGLPTVFGAATTGTTLTLDDGTWNTGGEPITATTYQWKRTKSGVTEPITGATNATVCLDNDADIIGSTISVTVSRTNSVGTTSATSAASAPVTENTECVAPAPPPPPSVADAPAPAAVPNPVVTPAAPRALPATLPPPPPVIGPVARNNPLAAPPARPTALVGGRAVVVETERTSPTGVNLRTGPVSIGMNVQSSQGTVSQQTDSTEIQVRSGGLAAMTGSGLLPRSTVQVFMPLQGTNSREIARIPVDATGAFSGDAIFGSTPTERPLPIGRQVLQLVTVDENREQTVVEMTINIAQPTPAPEFNRLEGVIPTLSVGQSVATNAGEPEIVTVTPNSEQKQATVEGDGWSMAVQVEGENGGVDSGANGGASVTFVRDQGALVSGDGFMPGTRADVWLFSDPTLLGSVQIDDTGAFSGEVNIDGAVVTVGEHTLQLQGVGEDGFVRAANLGVIVEDVAAEVTTEAASGFLWWLWLLVALGVVAASVGGAAMYRRATR